MPDTGLSRSPRVEKGAFVQLIRDVVGLIPYIVPFQYNPEKLSRAITPWNPFEGDQAQRGSQAPTVQPYEPRETINLTIDLDATDGMEDADPAAVLTGVAPQLAALRKLLVASDGPLADVANRARALVGASVRHAARPTVPVLLFVWGPGRILPVRITSFSADETLFSPRLYPIQAQVTLALEVLSPDMFKCQGDRAVQLAIAAYNATRLQEDALAIANVASDLASVRAILPF